MQVISLADMVIPPDVLAHVTEPMAQLYRIMPVSFQDDTLTIAMCDPQNLSILDELRNFLGYDIRAVVATERDMLKRAGPLLRRGRRERRDADRRHGEDDGAGRGRQGPGEGRRRST